MRKTCQKALKMCISLSCIALELFAAKIGGWEMGPHVRSGNFSKISSIFDACLSSGDHFFSKMSLTLQIANSTHRSGHQDKIADEKSCKFWREFEELKKCAQGFSRTRQILTGCAHEDPSLNPHAFPYLCRKQLRTFSNASRCVYDRKISKTIEKYRKILKIDQIWHLEKIRFRTVKVADFLQTVSPRCREWFPRVKSWGMGTFPIPN